MLRTSEHKCTSALKGTAATKGNPTVNTREVADPAGQGNLLAAVDAETWLLNRLQQHGVDVYAEGQFACLRDRIAYAILTHQHGSVIAGRGPGAKPESYEQLFLRLYGIKLKDAPKPTKAAA